jgi:tetratricopeptide (TPR) repeat protein
LYNQGRFVDAEVCFREAVRLNPNNDKNHHWLGNLLYNQGRFVDAEVCFREAVRLNPIDAVNHHWLGVSLYNQSRFVEAERCGLEAVRLNPKVADFHHWLGKARQSLRSFVEAQASFREAVRLDPENAIYSQHLGPMQHPDSSALADSVPKDGRPGSFVEFLLQGKFWLENSNWNVAGKSSLLQGLYDANCSWADPAFILFEGYEVNDDFLDESLARAESLSKNLHLQPSMPALLETSELSIAMTIEGVFLRAWVGKNQKGVAVAVNLTTWELHYPPGDIDGAFAVGAALNWFLDRSLAHPNHPHFQGDGGSAWKVSTGFYEDISNISAGVYPQPLKAHQVRGFIRTLEKGKPTDESRDNAPSYIRRHMGPNDTWVRPHNRGQGESAEKLVTHLAKFSSLADFLATAPRS